jgi:fumarate hydratase subunit alpha
MKSDIAALVRDTLVEAGSTFRADKKEAYRRAINAERNDKARWVLQTVLDNAEAAERDRSPLCDDTGIPHLLLEIGPDCAVSGRMLDEIREGVRQGLRKLPGRPMGILGDDRSRIDQSGGLDPDSAGVEPAPILLRRCEENVLRLHILMFGGGPAIRAKTYRVFHRHDTQVVLDEIVGWAKESVAQLGCSPCTLAVGIGRSHFEAASMMLQAQADGVYGVQSDMEEEITRRVNEANIGPLGLGGDTSVIATFMKVGPQRASGVRIVCLRPSCCFEPRIATVDLLKAGISGASTGE